MLLYLLEGMMANWDFRAVDGWVISVLGHDLAGVKVEGGEIMKLYVVPDGSPGGFRFQLRGKDYPVWLKEQRAAEEAAKKARGSRS